MAITANNGTIDTQSFNSTIAQNISGAGSLTKLGSGTLTLNGTNGYTGGTNVNAGTLVVGDGSNSLAALAGGGLVTVASGATLGGYGSVTGDVTNNGTISVANALASLASGPTGNLLVKGTLTNAGLVQLGGSGVGNMLTVAGKRGPKRDDCVEYDVGRRRCAVGQADRQRRRGERYEHAEGDERRRRRRADGDRRHPGRAGHQRRDDACRGVLAVGRLGQCGRVRTSSPRAARRPAPATAGTCATRCRRSRSRRSSAGQPTPPAEPPITPAEGTPESIVEAVDNAGTGGNPEPIYRPKCRYTRKRPLSRASSGCCRSIRSTTGRANRGYWPRTVRSRIVGTRMGRPQRHQAEGRRDRRTTARYGDAGRSGSVRGHHRERPSQPLRLLPRVLARGRRREGLRARAAGHGRRFAAGQRIQPRRLLDAHRPGRLVHRCGADGQRAHGSHAFDRQRQRLDERQRVHGRSKPGCRSRSATG